MPTLPGFHLPELDLAWWVVASIASLVGLALFVYGRRSKNPLHVIAGVVLMALPMFIENAAIMLGVTVGVGVGGFAWWMSR